MDNIKTFSLPLRTKYMLKGNVSLGKKKIGYQIIKRSGTQNQTHLNCISKRASVFHHSLGFVQQTFIL